MPTTTDDSPTEPIDTPRSARAPSPPTALERLGMIEGWVRDIDGRLVADEKRRDAMLVTQQHLAGEVVTIRQIVDAQGRHLKSIDGSLGVLARDLGARAKQDSVHEVQIADISRRLTVRRVLTASLGTGGALAITTAALVLAKLFLRWLGVDH